MIANREQIEEHMDNLSDICSMMRREIKAPVDELIEDALWNILQALRLMAGNDGD